MTTEHGAPTLDDVARAAGVSRSTASRAINGGERVSPEAQAAVDDAVARLGYSPNRAARSLVTRRTDSIALVVPEPDARILTDPFLAGVLRGVSEGLTGTELQLVLLLSRPDERPGHIARYLRSGHVDGAIVVSHHRDDRLEPELSRSHLPAVFVGRPFKPEGLHYVDVDNVAGCWGTAGTVVLRGHHRRPCRRVATITGPLDMTATLDRLEGWRAELGEAGLPADVVAHGDFTAAGGAAAMEQILDEHPDIDGLFAASDLMATGALEVLRARGRSVPDDVKIVGFDALGVAERTTPRLTTVEQPLVQMVSVATSTLLDMLAGERVADEPRILTPHLVEGETA
ncbi:LacI family transcriptional regulator [Isoptericola variabilis J7]|uniref:LacI family DNA-binding transcriptional regulator n=1 Tax=Isoptericola variabilis TaxID=139208 RepID=UPI0011A34E01|nr:LacI family DNA-binding transcriptional regulator [Isoptericola variabilis]TWH31447.1 LacI family transcriptional regulator [Isoptericola variabilis J7]